MRTTILIAILLFCAVGAKGADVTVEVCAIHVEAPIDAKEESGANFTFQPGTKVELLIKAPAGGIVQFDKDGSTLTEFTDEKGTNLLQKKEGSFSPSGFGMFSKISKDGKDCKIEVNSAQVPAKGATALKLKGAASIQCATSKVEKIQKDLALTKGSKLTLGELDFTVKGSGKPQWGNDPLEVTFTTTNKLDKLASIEFLKADGSVIKSSRTMSMSGMGSTQWTFSLGESVQAVTVRAQIWTDMQTISVPINVTAGAGL